MTNQLFERDMRQRFTQLSKVCGLDIAVLHIGSELTGLAIATEDNFPQIYALNLGFRRTVHEQFKSRMPEALLLENAIASTEDEIAKLPKIKLAASGLFCQDPLVREIALRSGLTAAQKIHLPLEVVERCFSRLANIAMGSTTGYEQLPDDPAFAATLLILREVMHHQHFPSITWMAKD